METSKNMHNTNNNICLLTSYDLINFEKNLDEFWKDQDLLYNDHKAKIKLNKMHDI